MARFLGESYSIIIRQYRDMENNILVKTVTFDGSAGDPDATNAFDKGPHEIRVDVPYEKVKTLEEIETIAVAAAGIKAAAPGGVKKIL